MNLRRDKKKLTKSSNWIKKPGRTIWKKCKYWEKFTFKHIHFNNKMLSLHGDYNAKFCEKMTIFSSTTRNQNSNNAHIFDICTIKLQNSNFLSWKLYGEYPCIRGTLLASSPPDRRHSCHFNNRIFHLENSVKKSYKDKSK